jgi:hypothetical protein
MTEQSAGGQLQGSADQPTSWWMLPARITDIAIAGLKSKPGSGLFVRLSNIMGRSGLFSVLVAGVSVMIFQIVTAIRTDSLSQFILCSLTPIALCLVQFIAFRFSEIGEAIVRNTPTTTSRFALYDLLGFIFVLGGLGAGGLGGYLFLQQGSLEFAVAGFLGLFGLGVIGFMFLTPSALNLHERTDNSAGADGLCLAGTFIKAIVAGSRLVFGCYAIIGALICMIGAIWFVFTKPEAQLSEDMQPEMFYLGGVTLTLAGALLPLVSYLFAILYFISVDVLMAILKIAQSSERR